MPIDTATVERDARNCIADWPVTVMHYPDRTNLSVWQQASVAIGPNDFDMLLEPGGLLASFSATLLAMVSDFPVLPKVFDRIDIQTKTGGWLETEVKRTPDMLDPLLPHCQITVGSPDV